MVGTLSYMAPEQIVGKGIDRRCDVFAVGCVLYELLSYQRAFAGDSKMASGIASSTSRRRRSATSWQASMQTSSPSWIARF